MLMKATDGLAVTADTPAAVLEVLDILASRDMLHGPPWKLSDTGLERVQQCVALQNNRQLLEVCSGPLEEATLFQLIRHLDRLGWEHEVITEAEHKRLKKTKYVHAHGPSVANVWYTRVHADTVNRNYLWALARLDGVDIKEVPYGAPDHVYLKLLGFTDEHIRERAAKRTRHCPCRGGRS